MRGMTTVMTFLVQLGTTKLMFIFELKQFRIEDPPIGAEVAKLRKERKSVYQ
jgi:hypothetical protein